MPKPKNDGAILSVRLAHEIHQKITEIQARLIASGKRPGEVTKTLVVTEAIRLLDTQQLPQPVEVPGA